MADLNGDGYDDLIARTAGIFGDQDSRAYLGPTPDGTMPDFEFTPFDQGSWRSITVDLNDDGQDDLVWGCCPVRWLWAGAS